MNNKIIQNEETKQEFEYNLLGRLKSDCEYYLNHGNRNNKHLWANDEKLQIKKMKSLYNKLVVKPEWLKMSNILEYEKLMENKKMNQQIINPQPTEQNPIIVKNYPYGRLRTDIRYYVESVKKKGDRFCAQTLNPKTQLWNKTKKSTYAAVIIVYENLDNNHIEAYHFSRSTDAEEYKKFMDFVGDVEFNDIQKEELRLLRAYIKVYENVSFECRTVKGRSFEDDKEKMSDFNKIPKEEFLKSYSYLTEEDYKETEEALKQKEIKESINKSVAVNYHNDGGSL